MTIKEKIVAAIKTKFPKVNLSKARLNAIADKIEKKIIDDETKIDAAVDEFNDFNPFVEIAKQDDKIRELEGKLKPAPEKKPGDETTTPVETTVIPDDEDVPKYMKTFIKNQEVLLEKISKLEGKTQAESIASKIEAKLKDVPKMFWSKRAFPTKDEDVDAFIEDVNTDLSEYNKELTEKGLAEIPIPGGGGTKQTAADTAKKATKEELDAVIGNII